MGRPYLRKKTIPVDYFLENKISDSSGIRLQSFKVNGKTCVTCGLEGKFFALERHKKQLTSKFHYNLYAINEHGHEILMTRDHIIPKSKDGPNTLENSQTMCTKCNGKKGDTYVSPLAK